MVNTNSKHHTKKMVPKDFTILDTFVDIWTLDT